MRLLDDSKLDMYYAVISYCDKNREAMSSLPALQTTFETFRNTVSDITFAAQQKEVIISGITADKHKMRKYLVEQSADLANKLFAYATFSGNNDLKQQVNFSVSRLSKLKDEELFNVCTNFSTVADTYLSLLMITGWQFLLAVMRRASAYPVPSHWRNYSKPPMTF